MDGPLVHTEPARGGAFHGLGNLPERLGNVCYRYELDWGDVDAAFAEADVVVEDVFEFGSAYQYSMETHACIAQVEGDEITLWANCQHPFLVRAEMASVFGVPLGRVRIVVPFLGGGFGSKSYTRMEPVTIAVARKAGRPVRIVNRVDESMLTSRQHAMRVRLRTAARADGTLLARDARCWFDTGAYADNGPRVVATGGTRHPARTAGSRPASAPTASTPTPRRPARTAPSGPCTCSGRASSRSTRSPAASASTPWRCGGATCSGREMIRPGGKPLDADLVGDVEKVAEALGWAPRASAGWAVASRWACWRPAPTRSRAPRCGSRPTARSRSTSARPRSARARGR